MVEITIVCWSLPTVQSWNMLEHVGTKVTTIMVVVLLIISSLFGYAAWLHRTSGQNGNLSRKEEILISVLRTGQGIQESLWS